MRTKVLMIFVYIFLAIFVLNMTVFFFALSQLGIDDLTNACLNIGYISLVIMFTLIAVKRKWDKQDSDQKDK